MDTWYRRLWSPSGPEGRLYRALGTLLTPAEWVYRAGVGFRSWAYDRNLLTGTSVPIPTLGVGNLTVGGTGKTPIAAWLARELARDGRRAAVVLRGYGGDEQGVHRILNPGLPVYTSADRVEALERALSEGCDVAVLDDAFQHRALRVARQIVLVAAEDWSANPRLLPRGPWREPLSALRRAQLIVITRKTVEAEIAVEVSERLAANAPGITRARAHIAVEGLARYDPSGLRAGETEEPAGVSVTLAVAGVVRPEVVREQLESIGVRIEEFRAFPDHHHYDRREIAWIRRRAGSGPIAMTLKDAVKLGPALCPDVDIRVAVQSVRWEANEEAVRGLLRDLVVTRTETG